MRAKMLFAIALAGLTAAASAQSQDRSSVLGGHDINAPVDVAADRVEVQERDDRALFVGNVVVRQGSLTLSTARLRLAYSSNAGLEIDRLDASGGVTVRSGDEAARSDFAVYDLDRRIITMIGNVRLTQSRNTIQGSRLTIDLESGRAVMDGGPRGIEGSGGRVTGTFTVPQRRD